MSAAPRLQAQKFVTFSKIWELVLCVITLLCKYVGPVYYRAEMYAGGVACCPVVSHGEYADGTDRRTDRRTPDRYITLSARRIQTNTLASPLSIHKSFVVY